MPQIIIYFFHAHPKISAALDHHLPAATGTISRFLLPDFEIIAVDSRNSERFHFNVLHANTNMNQIIRRSRFYLQLQIAFCDTAIN